MSRRRRALVPGAEEALDKYKMELAMEEAHRIMATGGPNAGELVNIGGLMVKRMIRQAEQDIISNQNAQQ